MNNFPPLLSLHSVTKSYIVGDRELPILKGISIDIPQGGFVAFMGPSGSGKSTLLHLMGALDRPTSGVIRLDGNNIQAMSDTELARIRNQYLGFVFQNFFLLSYYTAIENVCLPLVYAGLVNEKRSRAEMLLKRVGLSHRMDHRPNTLSGGEKQRVAIARALVNDPKIIFADEPTGALDQKTGESIMSLLKEINQQGTTVILITHDPQVARQAHEVIHIRDGLVTSRTSR